jgi:hypothetical protein
MFHAFNCQTILEYAMHSNLAHQTVASAPDVLDLAVQTDICLSVCLSVAAVNLRGVDLQASNFG